MSEIILKDLSKSYDSENYSVKDFNLQIADGEFIILVGPSGCGKSTTLRLIAGLEAITSGELFIDSQLMNKVAPKDRDLAMVFQDYALYPNMSVYKNMAYPLKMRGLSKTEIDAKVNRAAALLGLDTLLNRKPGQLSGGQKQRVALGRAIVREPNAFLMDEPLSNLDAKLRVQMRYEISKLHQNLGTTIIYVTHDQTEAMTMGDRIVVMNAGAVQQIGTPDEIYDQPANLFVAEFMGSPKINLFAGVVSDHAVVLPDNQRLELSSDRLDLQDSSQAVKIGVRPENIRLVAGDTYQITLIENLGNQQYIYVENAGHQLIVQTNREQRFAIGQQVDIEIINLNKVNLFAAQSGELL